MSRMIKLIRCCRRCNSVWYCLSMRAIFLSVFSSDSLSFLSNTPPRSWPCSSCHLTCTIITCSFCFPGPPALPWTQSHTASASSPARDPASPSCERFPSRTPPPSGHPWQHPMLTSAKILTTSTVSTPHLLTPLVSPGQQHVDLLWPTRNPS